MTLLSSARLAMRRVRGVLVPGTTKPYRPPPGACVVYRNDSTRRLHVLHSDGTDERLESLRDLGGEGHAARLGQASDEGSDGDGLSLDLATARYLHRSQAEELALQGFARNFVLFDDFASNHLGGGPGPGSLPWFQSDGSGGGTVGNPGGLNAFGQWSEFGVARFTSGATLGNFTVWHLGINSRQTAQGPPPTGTIYEVKLKIPTASPNGERWAGMWSHETTYPDAALANMIRGIGFVTRPTGSATNWLCLTRNGTVETTTDSGLLADNTWRTLRWRKTAAGVEFFKVVGDVATSIAVHTTNLPGAANNQIPMFGVRAGSAAVQDQDVDYVGIAGKLVRN